MLVKEVMTKNIITIDKDKTIFDACNMYKKHKIGCLIITENNELVGILTERDIIERTICEHRNPETTTVEEVMSSDIKTIHQLATLETAIDIMTKYNVKKLPVVIQAGLVGIVTATDISRARPDLSKRFIETWIKTRWHD